MLLFFVLVTDGRNRTVRGPKTKFWAVLTHVPICGGHRWFGLHFHQFSLNFRPLAGWVPKCSMYKVFLSYGTGRRFVRDSMRFIASWFDDVPKPWRKLAEDSIRDSVRVLWGRNFGAGNQIIILCVNQSNHPCFGCGIKATKTAIAKSCIVNVFMYVFIFQWVS